MVCSLSAIIKIFIYERNDITNKLTKIYKKHKKAIIILIILLIVSYTLVDNIIMYTQIGGYVIFSGDHDASDSNASGFIYNGKEYVDIVSGAYVGTEDEEYEECYLDSEAMNYWKRLYRTWGRFFRLDIRQGMGLRLDK